MMSGFFVVVGLVAGVCALFVSLSTRPMSEAISAIEQELERD
jgi:hypothetical protein